MLSIQPPSASKPQKCTPNLLPARIHHDGPINDPQRYWTPEKDEDGMSTIANSPLFMFAGLDVA